MRAVHKIDIEQKFSTLSEHWRPKTIAGMNGQEVKLVKVKGVFPWHVHADEDEMFLVWRGNFRVEFPDHSVELAAGEMIVVPRGTEHRTAADEEAEVVIFEPVATRNTGNVIDDEFTAPLSVNI
jgi:mannose-6-phosphate isomerase-like protein (cupin superfamily)